MNDLERQETTQTLVGWLIEAGGATLADFWLWSATPFPFGLPSDHQLEEGLQLATGELTAVELSTRVEAHLDAALVEAAG